VFIINASWRDDGARRLRLANEIAADRPKEEHEKWGPDEPDYSGLRMGIIYSPAFRELDRKPIDLNDFWSLDDFARRVSDCAESITLQNYSHEESYGFCGALALASFLGYPPDGINGMEAMKGMCAGKYNVSGMSLRILARCAGQPMPEDFIECLMDLDNEDIAQIKNRGARIVWFARRILENISLMTDDEKEYWGGNTLSVLVMCNHIEQNDVGTIDGSPEFWKFDKLVSPRRIKPDTAKVNALVKKYKAILADSANDWDFIGRLLGFAPHPEWESAEDVYRPGWYDKGWTIMAIKRTAEAAIMGNPAAQRRLAELYETGTFGMERNTEKARYWLGFSMK
jgi:hypothetical protein